MSGMQGSVSGEVNQQGPPGQAEENPKDLDEGLAAQPTNASGKDDELPAQNIQRRLGNNAHQPLPNDLDAGPRAQPNE